MDKPTKTPGLSYRNGRPQWRATKSAVKAGYPVKVVNLSSMIDDPVQLRARCIKLQREMSEWVVNGERKPIFNGSFGSLLDIYQSDPQSSYCKLKRSSREPYDIYIGMLKVEIGRTLIDRTDGRDLALWFTSWSTPNVEGGRRPIARARMAINVLKAAVRFGVLCRLPGCSQFREILSASTFETVPARTAVITVEQITKARAAAHALGHPALALCYAIQFDAGVRQWDVRGQWEPLSDPRPSAVIDRGEKWIGPTWGSVDDNLILRIKPTKTEDTTGAEIVVDLRTCPMVMEELEKDTGAVRKGPLIKHPRTGLPYRDTRFQDVWRSVAEAADIPTDVWNRDLRASSITEARAANASIDDIKKAVGHTPNSNTTGKVYDRAALEAQRRIAAAKKLHRSPK